MKRRIVSPDSPGSASSGQPPRLRRPRRRRRGSHHGQRGLRRPRTEGQSPRTMNDPTSGRRYWGSRSGTNSESPRAGGAVQLRGIFPVLQTVHRDHRPAQEQGFVLRLLHVTWRGGCVWRVKHHLVNRVARDAMGRRADCLKAPRDGALLPTVPAPTSEQPHD